MAFRAAAANVLPTATTRDSAGQNAVSARTVQAAAAGFGAADQWTAVGAAAVVYAGTTYTPATPRVLADAALRNNSSTALAGEIAAVHRHFDDPAVDLSSAFPATADGERFIDFNLGAGLAAGASSAAQRERPRRPTPKAASSGRKPAAHFLQW